MDSNYPKKVRKMRALHHFEGFRASRETRLFPQVIAFSREAEKTHRTEF
jgi:hypothetical protein